MGVQSRAPFLLTMMSVFERIKTANRPLVMGIINTTPDSFSDGGNNNGLDLAFASAKAMLDAGADILDIGGESTRPGAAPVSLQEELDRTIPVIEAIRSEFNTCISIDTQKPTVMIEAVNAGASLVNDVNALQAPGAIATVAESGADVCLMHMQGTPENMQDAPSYKNVVDEVVGFLAQRIGQCERAGIPKQKILVDPGFGFGKTLDDNYQLLGQLGDFSGLGVPLLIGVSRKSMIGNLLERPVAGRLAGSLAAALFAAEQGAKVLRVHDVRETVDALRVWLEAGKYKNQKNK